MAAIPGGPPLHAAAFAPRERTRALLRAAFPRRRWRLTIARTPQRFAQLFAGTLVDVAVVDLGAPVERSAAACALAREFPTVAFLGLSPYLLQDTPLIARAAELELADVLAEGVDDGALAAIAGSLAFSRRFAESLHEPPAALALTQPVQVATWRVLLGCPARPVRTAELASWLRVTREHLSRSFRSGGRAPTLKRVSDLVRLLAAAQLAKNPGYDLDDVARLLGFPSRSHLSRTARRLLGRTSDSLPRLRTSDLLRHFEREGEGRAATRTARPRGTPAA